MQKLGKTGKRCGNTAYQFVFLQHFSFFKLSSSVSITHRNTVHIHFFYFLYDSILYSHFLRFYKHPEPYFLNVPGKSTVPCPVSIVHKKVSLNLGTVEYTGKIKCPANVYNKLTSAKLCSTILQLRPILTVWTRLFAYIFAKVLTIT